MLKFLTPGPCGDMQGSLSPYAAKLDLWLRMAGIPHERDVQPFMPMMAAAPKGLFPYVELDGEIVDDSSIIIDRLKELHDDPLDDARLTAKQKATGELVKSMCEHELQFIMAYGRFGDDASDYRSLISFNFGGLPDEELDALLDDTRAFVVDKLHHWKIGRQKPEFVEQELRRCLSALSANLGDQPYLFGDKPSTYDATLYGILSSLVYFPFRNSQVAVSREYTNLLEYCDRLQAEFFDYKPKQ